MSQSIKVRHNVEMAHRLSQTPGKCENIHGHSWWVELEIEGAVNHDGMILEYGYVKKLFRTFLDETFDHRLALNQYDPLVAFDGGSQIPGLTITAGDPTTENMARWIGEWAEREFGEFGITVTVWETSVNCATWRSS